MGGLIEAIGTEDYPVRLTGFLRSVAPFDQIAIMIYRERNPPIRIHDDFRGAQARKGLAQYLDQTYLLNPFFQNHLEGIGSGVYRMRDLAPDRYFESEFYKSYQVIVLAQEEIGYITKDWPRGLEEVDIAVPLGPGETTEIGIYRSVQNGGFEDAALERLRHIQPVVTASFRQHWQRIRARYIGENGAGARWGDAAFQDFGRASLTAREREVLVLVLRGHSSESIAAHLAISRATVKTHRKHGYEKLGIATQAELLSLFLEHIRTRQAA